jgi:hypothetical protein
MSDVSRAEISCGVLALASMPSSISRFFGEYLLQRAVEPVHDLLVAWTRLK